jgi:hypothetical protein
VRVHIYENKIFSDVVLSVQLFFLPPEYKMSVRRAYFKNVEASVIDASQNEVIVSLANRLSAVETGKADASALGAKADLIYVDSEIGGVNSTLQEKLDISTASATYATAMSVMQKADSSYVESRLNTLDGSKADASQLLTIQQDVSTARSIAEAAQLSANTKLDIGTYQARVAAENAFISALKDVLYIESSAGSNTEYDYSVLGLSA